MATLERGPASSLNASLMAWDIVAITNLPSHARLPDRDCGIVGPAVSACAPGVKALRYAPTPLRGSALTPAPRTLVQMALDDDACPYAPQNRRLCGRRLTASRLTWAATRVSSASTSFSTTSLCRDDTGPSGPSRLTTAPPLSAPA